MKFPRRVDKNQPQIVKVLRDMGCKVFVTSSMGNGFPDLAVLINKLTYLIEIKDGEKPPSAQKLTISEKEFHELWENTVIMINSVESAIDFVNTERT
jgi:Holliday junction resolvase